SRPSSLCGGPGESRRSSGGAGQRGDRDRHPLPDPPAPAGGLCHPVLPPWRLPRRGTRRRPGAVAPHVPRAASGATGLRDQGYPVEARQSWAGGSLTRTGMNPLRCVLITPARNEEAFIAKTIQSMVSPTVRPIRWVIVNDGSTDRTGAIARRYEAV